MTVERGSSSFLQVLAFYSPDGRYDDLFTSNYVTLNVLDQLKRLPGTTNVQIFGAKDYAMRIWLKPDRLAQLKLTPADVDRARSTSRTRSSPPARSASRRSTQGQDLVYTITTQGRLAEPQGVRADHRPRESRRLDGAARPTSRASSWARRTTSSSAATTASERRWSASSCARRQRARASPRRCEPTMAELATALPRGPRPTRSPTTRRASSRCRSARCVIHARRGDAARVPRRLPVPAELARDDHPVRRGAGVADRHVRRPLRCSATRSTR